MKEIIVAILAIIFIPLIIGIVGAGLGIINLPFFNLGKKVDLNYGVINRTYDTDYCLSNYEWFKQTLEDIKATDEKVVTQQNALDSFVKSAGPRKNWTFEDKSLYSDLLGKVTGLQNIKSQLVADYNARTQQLNRVACQELPLFVKP